MLLELWACIGFFIFIKSVTIGSSFSFYKWFRYGNEYVRWYDKTILRSKFIPKEKENE